MKNKFIDTFVNEMYAILIGIGIGNILFGQEIDLKNIPDLVMMFFVTTVVLKYWWDWTEYISENVISSKREFAIDFMILIGLEFLFGFYNRPFKLSLIFVVLAVLNLFWVWNHLFEFKQENRHKAGKWIFEKAIGIVIYVTISLLLYHFRTVIHHYLQISMVIIGYFLVRKLSFKQLKAEEEFIILPAETKEAAAIVELNNNAMDTSSNEGFMIIELHLKEVKDNIKKGNFYIIKKKRSGILGFVEVSDNVNKEILENLDWIDFIEQDRFAQKKKKYIDKIVVKKELRDQKIGSMLYDFLFEKYQDLLLYSFVIIKPYGNEASMNFHLKKGFVKSAIFSADEFCELKDYKSILMIKGEK